MSDLVRTVLLAIDFQDGSHAALRMASEICREHEARLVLFHALPGSAAPTDPRSPSPGPPHEILHDAVLRALGGQAEVFAVDDAQLLVETRPESPGTAILDAARRVRAELIVVASSRLQGAARWLSDSVSAEVFEHADRPVLVVHPEDAGFKGPMESVVVVTDTEALPRRSLVFATRLLPSKDELRVVLLHVAEDSVEAGAARLLSDDPRPLSTENLRFESLVVGGDPRRAIPERARGEDADLLVMPVSPSSPVLEHFRTSVEEATAVGATCPLLFWPGR